MTQCALISIAAVLIVYKVGFLNYSFSNILPVENYEVTITMSAQGFGDPVELKTYLPAIDSRQQIYREINDSSGFEFEISSDKSGRLGRWYIARGTGALQASYSFNVASQFIKYTIDESITIPDTYPKSFAQYLEATPSIQVNHPFIIEIYNRVVPDTKNLREVLSAIYSYVDSLKPMEFKGLTDAVTAAKLGEASCNGKSRLFIALARRAGIPARLVGGLILTGGTKRTSHQWVEVHVNGYWVPFDALNRHFAEIPRNYLLLYRGDEFLFKHSPNINFDYTFKVRKRLVSHSGFFAELKSHPFNAYRAWEAFERVGIPLNLLKIILMIPLGAFVVVVFRNVVGLETFGIFLPALVATASRETGFLWGAVGFILVVGIVSLVHYPLEKLGILYTPKMAIMLISIVAVMLSLTVAGVRFRLFSLSYVSLFPIVVLTITAERFALKLTEDGFLDAVRVVAMTLIVAWFSYVLMNSLVMESLFLAFPELYLVLIALQLWIGTWVGMRITEYRRFRWLLER